MTRQRIAVKQQRILSCAKKLWVFKYSSHILDCITKSGDSWKKTVCNRNGFLFTEFLFFGTKNTILRSANRALENMSTLQWAYLEADKPTFEGGGGVGGRWFRGKKIVARKITPGEKNLLYWKISFMAYNAEIKPHTVVCQEREL